MDIKYKFYKATSEFCFTEGWYFWRPIDCSDPFYWEAYFVERSDHNDPTFWQNGIDMKLNDRMFSRGEWSKIHHE